jgi:hypothetical protein
MGISRAVVSTLQGSFAGDGRQSGHWVGRYRQTVGVFFLGSVTRRWRPLDPALHGCRQRACGKRINVASSCR